LFLKVGDREHSAVLETDVLDADKFPSFFAQKGSGRFERLPWLAFGFSRNDLSESWSLSGLPCIPILPIQTSPLAWLF